MTKFNGGGGGVGVANTNPGGIPYICIKDRGRKLLVRRGHPQAYIHVYTDM